jgi:hypothetical protein
MRLIRLTENGVVHVWPEHTGRTLCGEVPTRGDTFAAVLAEDISTGSG